MEVYIVPIALYEDGMIKGYKCSEPKRVLFPLPKQKYVLFC